ncbi:hypothetical protein [Nocardiopsis ganjiahuensis]|uniref:hypothetical protein n=1 Tax=Nocardiopsis ganjiahuensis TaxID=239984 RepID=UPI00034BFD69|nr:hypothetical protein [Nocardiopsis ganjiahuensis]
MPNRTLSFAYTACVAFAALIAFLLAATAEPTLHVLERSALVWITENDGTHDTDDVARSVQEVADSHDAAIGYSVLDVHDPSSLAHLYLAVSDPDSRYARWLDEGYPSFGRSFTIRTHPLAEFGGVGPNGYYLVFGPPEAEPALREALAGHGLSEAPGTQTTRLWHFLAGGHLLHLVAVALLTTVTATGAGVLLSSRDHAVRRLQGRSYAGILAGELTGVLRLWAVVLPVAAAAVAGFLGLYNGGNQLGFYTSLALLLFALLALACLVAHALALALVHTTGVLPALKGRLPVRGTTVAVHLVRVPVLVLTLALLGTVVATSQEARDQRAGLEILERYGEVSRPALSASYGWSDERAVDEALGPWLRRADTDGHMVLAARLRPAEIVPVGPGPPGKISGRGSPGTPVLEHPVLVVNDTYLREEAVLSPSGERYGPSGNVRVLLPVSAAGHAEQLAEGVAGWLGSNSGPGREFDVEVLPAADGQTVFTYGAGERVGEALPLLHEPVVVALPNGSVLSDNGYVNHMSGRQTVFPDPDVVEAFRADDPEASRYVSMVEPLGTSALRAHAVTVNTLRTELFNLVGAGTVLLLTAMAACVVHVRTRAQEIFARHISGWGLLATHRRLLAAEAAVAAVFVGWALWSTVTGTAAANDPARPAPTAVTGAEPLHALGIALASLALTLGALALFHRRLVREGASQA